MSRETMQWLNNMTLIGFTEKRGNAWHYMESEQGVEPNHYVGAVPTEDVRRRLFDVLKVQEATLSASYLTPDGVGVISDDDRKAVIRPAGTFGADDKGQILGTFKSGYVIHGYDDWLLANLNLILDGGAKVASAGLLAGGGVAWVQAQLDEDNVVTKHGVEFRPFLTASTSCNGTLATTYKRGVVNVVCDNTHGAHLKAKTEQVKVKHSRRSLSKLAEVRDVLGLINEVAADFQAEVDALCEQEVTMHQWGLFLDATVPVTEPDGTAKTGRGLTMATNKRDALVTLWNNDNRVSPWKGTAWGVVQAINTFEHHIATVRNVSRGERNTDKMVRGEWDTVDNDTLDTLNKVLASA